MTELENDMLRSPILKRAIDVAGSLVGLLAGAPFLLIGAGLVRLRMGPGVIFRQLRPGLQGKPFTLYKLRTMTETRDAKGNLLPDGDRLTLLGKTLRKLSIDELPQLWNVLRGEMSLVGPRPLRMEYLPLYTAFQARRHDVKPGITGWAQVSGRNGISWEEKFQLDVEYVDRWSIWFDIEIVVRTVGVLLSGSAVSETGHATARAFEGSEGKEVGHGSEPVSAGSTNRTLTDSGIRRLKMSQELGGARH